MVDQLNDLDNASLEAALTRCCAAPQWVRQLAAEKPFLSDEELMEKAARIWNRIGPEDWLQAFAAHPRIGDVEALHSKFSGTRAWTRTEQAGVAGVAEDVLQRFLTLNHQYEAKFGYIFIVCATGKTAQEMLILLERRLANDERTELQLAAAEQLKITLLRLRKLAQ
jgi:2-oxo-4-hydroxy-4-carboxy-5-ureidoimidazoline decarboxylase